MQYIIMQDKHPIDELFRQGLEKASVDPPASVWAGVRRSRGRGGWWWKASLSALLLGLGVATWTITGHQGRTGRADLAGHSTREHVDASLGGRFQGEPTAATTPMYDGRPASSATGQRSMKPSGSPASSDTGHRSAPLHDPLDQAGGSTRAAGNSKAPGADQDGKEEWLAVQPSAGRSSSDLGYPGTREGLPRLLLIPVELGRTAATPLGAREEAYVLRAADIWVSAELGLFRWDQQHTGNDAALAADRDRSLSPGPEAGAGMLVGRTWRNGLRIGIGISRHVGEQAFVHDTRKDSLAWDVLENVTVLDTMVITQAIDSVGTLYPRATRTTGTTRYESWVLPVEVGWGLRRGRWELELLAGLDWERRRRTSGPMLFRTGEGTSTPVLNTDEAALPSDVFGLRTGLMAGFWPTERIRVSAGPWHDRGILSPSDDGSLHRRTGGRFRLTYILERPGR